MSEVLVVLSVDDPSAAQAARRQMPALGGHIAQSYGPHVLIVEAPAEAASALRAAPGIAGVYPGSVPDDLSARLDEVGRLGVAAWNERHAPDFRRKKRKRKGEGLSWGHPDFDQEG